MWLSLLIFAVSLAALVKSSDIFIQSAERIGLSLGIPSFIVGVTIVAFGTSLPELATSIVSVYAGASDVVIGNVVGSNITNILLVVGIMAVYAKRIDLRPNIMDIDIPMLVLSSFLLFFSVRDGHFSLIEALLFVVALVIFLAHSITSEGDEDMTRQRIKPLDIGLFLVGGVGVYLGAKYTISSLIEMASMLQIETEVIAVSLVALGTSLPEVVVSLAATRRGQTDIAFGNILGSNIFNTYAVMALPSFFGTLDLPATIVDFNLLLMVAVTILFAFMCMAKRISRWEGMLLLLMYIYFLSNLIQTS